MRSPNRRRAAALAALAVGILVTAGCGGTGGAGAPGAQQLSFEPAAARGSDPFTPSTAVAGRTAAGPPGRPTAAGRARTLPGSTPGLYGGTRSASSCDVERQIRFLTETASTTRAFARAAGLGTASVPTFLRGLTPVVLRADTRVTDHGLRAGRSTSFQAVLQAGTAVLTDDLGVPRVRCSGGNPLRPAVAIRGAVTHRGSPWPGYRPERVVVIDRAPRPVGGLVLVEAGGKHWIERATGTDGDHDRTPGVMPAYAPGADLFDPQEVAPPDASVAVAPTPSAPGPAPTASAAVDAPAEPAAPVEPQQPSDEQTAGPDAPPAPADPAAPDGPDAARQDAPLPPDAEYPGGPDAPAPQDLLMGPDSPQG